MKVFIFSQKLKKEDGFLIEHLLAKFETAKFEIAMFDKTNLELKTIVENCPGIEVIPEGSKLKADNIDFIMTLGGDGTMLKAAALVGDSGIPIIGINLGRLGFLSSVEKSKINGAIDKIKDGKYKIEGRSMIALHCNYPVFDDHPYALNDFTIHKRDTSSMVSVHTYIDGVYLNTYWADGLIVATPTGSTGYSLACGGPIIFPSSSNFVITPIAPHNLNVRPLIIRDDVEISFEIEGRAENYLCTLDSRYETITDDYKIAIRKAPHYTNLMVLEGHHFMSTIRDKLLWGLDKRN